MVRVWLLAPLLLSAGCAASWQGDYDRLGDESAAVPVIHESAPRAPWTDPELDRVLAGRPDLPTLVALVRTRNPELREASARTRAGLEEVRRAGALDDPMFKLETEGVPLRHPGSPNRAEDNKAGFSQSFPFPGTLSLRSEAALRDAEAVHQRYRERERDVIARLKKAYADYTYAVRAIEAHDEHLALMQATEKISDAKFRNGAVSQQDVLKPQLEQITLHAEVLAVEQLKESSRAAINTLLHRPVEAPLGEPVDPATPAKAFDLAALQARTAASRPDLQAADLRVKSLRASIDASKRERDLPGFAVGVDYMQVPGGPDGYGVMLSINLPWFTGKRSAEVRGLEHTLRAEEAALDAARGRAQYEVRDAWLRTESARKAAVLLRNELLPKTAQTVEVSRASYEKDKSSFLDLLDAERTLFDVKLKHIQAATQYESAAADLERAVGADLGRTP